MTQNFDKKLFYLNKVLIVSPVFHVERYFYRLTTEGKINRN